MTIFRFVVPGSGEWSAARELRYAAFFQPAGLPRSSMDDDEERHGTHLVALVGDEVVGYGRLFAPAPGEFHLSQLVVAPHQQGRGTGRELLRLLIDTARNHGGSRVRLQARLPAVAFYQAAGFRPEGESFLSATTGVPHVHMALDIEASDP